MMGTVLDNSRIRNIPKEQLFQKYITEMKQAAIKSIRLNLKKKLNSITSDLELIELISGFDVISEFEYEKVLPQLPKKIRKIVKTLHSQLKALEDASLVMETSINSIEISKYISASSVTTLDEEDFTFETTVEKF